MQQLKYNPFLSPPDFALAQRHYRCTLVPHPLQPSIECPCCRQIQTFHRPSLFIKTKDLIYLGAQIPYLFYFLEGILILMVSSIFIATGQFIACGVIDEQLCKIFKVEVKFFDQKIVVPVGFADMSALMEYVHAIVIGVYFLAIFIFEVRLNYRYQELSRRKLGYADFSIILDNVPTNAVKDDIVAFMKDLEYSIRGVTLVKKTNILRKMLQHRRQVRKKLTKAVNESNRYDINNYTFEWLQMTSLIRQYQINQTQTRYRTNQVFVTFHSLADKKEFLKAYKKGFLHKFFFNCCTPCSPTTIKNSHISFMDAPPPRDIIWKNLEKPFFRTRFRRFVSFIFSFLVVIFGASAAFGLKSFPSSLLVGIGFGLFMQINNFLIVEFLNYSISSEHYWTHTQTKVCQVNRLTFFLFLNITIVPFLLYVYGILLDQDQSQLWNQMAFSVLFISLSNIGKPIILLLDVGYFFKMFKRYKQKIKGSYSILSQFQAHALFEAPEFEIHVIYSLILSSLLSTFFFLSKMPILIAPQIVLIIFLILTSRYLLTRRCKTPFRFTSKLSKCVNRIFTLCIPLLYAGHLLFDLIEQKDKFLSKFIQNVYPGLQAGLIILYFVVINLMNVPRLIAKWMIKRQMDDHQRSGSTDLTSSMNYSQSDPMLRLLDDSNTHSQMERIPDERDIARLLQTQYNM